MAHQPHARGGSEGEVAPLSGDTIAAVATPPGRGGIGVIRVSGPLASSIARAIVGTLPAARVATRADFKSGAGELLDQGIALYFAGPRSYTGEDVLELQGHGGPVVMSELLGRCVSLGARIAEPGEFTRRAFLNERLDLAQAESVADLIDAASVEAARSAARSLAGLFSSRLHALAAELMALRVHVEACIDFPEEEIDPADRSQQRIALAKIRAELEALLADARQGALLREGFAVALVGRPNVGKSSLLNRLAGEDLAIVTPIPGTTRDYVRASISIEGIPLHLVDTAGLRHATDEVERLGVERSWRALHSAGAALFIQDAEGPNGEDERLRRQLPASLRVLRVVNKIDLTGLDPGRADEQGQAVVHVSAKTGAGLGALRAWLLEAAGWRPHAEGLFSARQRHLSHLEACRGALAHASEEQAFEIVAEELRQAQQALGRITGEVSADDLLGSIFASFCIGK